MKVILYDIKEINKFTLFVNRYCKGGIHCPTMHGLHSIIAGIALLPASIIAGMLWTAFGTVVSFALGAGLSLASALIPAFGLPCKTVPVQ